MECQVAAEFSVGDKVWVDGCRELTGIITAIQWRHVDMVNFEVSWISNGEPKIALIESWRLTLASP